MSQHFFYSKTAIYAKAALLTQRIGLSRLSWHCARQAGFFGNPAASDEGCEFVRVADRVEHWAYVQGYSGKVFPRAVRKVCAKSTLHRAWLAGHMGIFEQADMRFGVTSRSNFRYRK
ncbi:TPA: hypothetical protein L3645_006148 [Pseudomonas aeruginosa]|nr:hypothetical protein [Pseudomonas aeruginosa]